MEDPAQAARKAAWITSSRDLLQSAYPMIEAILYFDTQMTRNGFTHTWPVDTSQNAYNAYRAMGQDPYFNPPHGPGGGGVIFADGFGAGSLSSWTTTTRFTVDDCDSATRHPQRPSAGQQPERVGSRALGSTHSAVCMGVRVNVAARSGSLCCSGCGPPPTEPSCGCSSTRPASSRSARMSPACSAARAWRWDPGGTRCVFVEPSVGAGSWTLSRDGTPVLAGLDSQHGNDRRGPRRHRQHLGQDVHRQLRRRAGRTSSPELGRISPSDARAHKPEVLLWECRTGRYPPPSSVART